jgi:FKBP-type peptidyl-prolyl cis-trans isomerase FkpA
MKQILTFFFLPALLAATVACGGSSSAPSSSSTDGVSSITTLQITDTKVGTGAEATNGKTLTVNYTGWLYQESDPNKHGARFDGGQYSFVLGTGRVIAGWDQGLLGMKVGGQRTLIIPPSLGYGAAGAPPSIPPNATLVFDTELVNVQ